MKKKSIGTAKCGMLNYGRRLKLSFGSWCTEECLPGRTLGRKGFIGPSRCPLCGIEEETMNHLLNTCEWADKLRNWMETILKRTNRVRNSIQETIENWRGNFSNTQMVNTIWKRIPGFITWSVWKERNKIVLLNETRNINFIKDTILQNIRETVLSKGKVEQDKNIPISNLQILKAFGIEMGTITFLSNQWQQQSTDVNT